MRKFLILASASALVGGAALAMQLTTPASAGQSPSPMMKVQTRAEVVARVRESFAKLDADRDGFVTKAEADSARESMRGQTRQRFAQQLGQPGAAAPRPAGGGAAAFDQLDTNKDGVVSRDEFSAGRKLRGKRPMAGEDQGGERGMRMSGGRMAGLFGRMFEMSDANKDGKVSLQEAEAAALSRFDTADANKDGQLTPQERMQMQQRMRAQRNTG